MSRSMRFCSLVLLSVFIAPWATEAKVVGSFDECSQFFCKGVEPLLFQAIVPLFNASRICQRYHGEYHFATVYNTALRIPVYSAYKKMYSTTDSRSRPKKFFIEPQLDLPDGSADMIPEPQDGVGKNQALNSDYTNTQYERGHLYPYSFNPGRGFATCTLTNAVPMTKRMNGHWYRCAEKLVNAVQEMCPPLTTLFAITGTIPSNQYLKDRVNIPDRVFTYYSCCPEGRDNETDNETVSETEVSGGYSISLDVATGELVVETATLEKLQEWLGSLIEVNPEWSNYAVSRNEARLLKVISEVLKPSWLPSLELSDISTALFDALRFIALGVYAWVAWGVYGMLGVIYGLVRVVWGVFSAVAALIGLVVAAVTGIISIILGLIGAIASAIGALVSKCFLSVVNTLLSLITSVAKFLLTSIASIPTHIVGFLTKLLTLVSGMSFSLPQLCGLLLSSFWGLLTSFVGLFLGAICLIAICAKYLPNAPSEIIDYLRRLGEIAVKTQPPSQDKSEWVSRVLRRLRDLLRKVWTAISDIPPPWKMLLVALSFFSSLLLGGWAAVLIVVGSVFSLVAGIISGTGKVVLGIEALVCLVPQTIGSMVSFCIANVAWIFTTFIPRLLYPLGTSFSKTPVLHPLLILFVVMVLVTAVHQLKQRTRLASSPSVSQSCKLRSHSPVRSDAKHNILKVYVSHAMGFCVENDIPTLVIALGSFIGHTVTSAFMHVGIRVMLGMVVAALLSVVADGTKLRYYRAFLITAFAGSAIFIYNAIAYFITGMYCVMCAIFTTIGPIIFIVIVTGIGIMIVIGDNLDGFSERGGQFFARINSNLPTPLSTAILSTATRVREASRNRSPVVVCLMVIIVILIILTSDAVKGIVTEFLKVAFLTGFLIVLALVTRESINPRRD